MTIKKVHVSQIKRGDIILLEGVETTVCSKDITAGFHGTSIFGDSYRSGSILVSKVIYPIYIKGKRI